MSIRKLSNSNKFEKTGVVSNDTDAVKYLYDKDAGNTLSNKDESEISDSQLDNTKDSYDSSGINKSYENNESSSEDDLTNVNYDANKSIPKINNDSLNNVAKTNKIQSLNENIVNDVFAKSALDDISVMPKGYFFTKDKKLFHKVGNSNTNLGYAIRIVKRYKDMDSGKESYLGQYLEPYNSFTHVFTADATLFIPSGYHLLIEKGLPLSNSNMQNIQNYFMAQKSLLPVNLKYSNIG